MDNIMNEVLDDIIIFWNGMDADVYHNWTEYDHLKQILHVSVFLFLKDMTDDDPDIDIDHKLDNIFETKYYHHYNNMIKYIKNMILLGPSHPIHICPKCNNHNDIVSHYYDILTDGLST